ncbi:CBO0543 family protein [Alkalihalobacterium bogoriense]|uniref:CBO0543 family protein n=1 Tax=Alkalihalobacterium bogoriense TaxID=246272 RepID=UPI00047B22CD|nr:CBO0543 family protein [Alkalihalobacterium bogoriense]
MHVVITIIVILAVWKSRTYKNWKLYHTTMLYYACGNLAYNFLCANYLLWKFNPDFLVNHTITEMVYTFVVFPGTILLFLGHYPQTFRKQVVHNGVWIFIYIGIEYIYLVTDRIYYQYGWTYWWSVILVAVMFPMFRLHHTRPLLTYILSVPITIILLWIFDVPVNTPMELRLE